MNFLTVHNVKKVFNEGSQSQSNALNGIDLSIGKEEFIVISGPSGSGKSTLLNIIGGLDTPSEGTVELEGTVITALGENDLALFRRENIGFVFQAYNLIPVLSVKENIEYVMRLMGMSQSECDARVLEVARELDIDAYLNKLPDHLSGGQQQRVAVARAVASKPKLILADEPTANLDTGNGEKLMELMRRLNEEEKVTIIFSSHDPMVISKARRSIVLRDGEIIEDTLRS
ncbi:MAG: ABC transporter ATP-binding protein [Sulfuricurvum sp.]|jgi:putative ABC transport system ATP-binding protein|uniref:ABC transporter ATP-binding protein n=1 Tax=Sulfuricurvum sp. TaxID=2025608 RepID=UPI0025F7AC85|nr:ABC transporter ATP-binding protein [Sulfuricurvum sp.]MCK9374472.1 ABC transporter ATP-binding protein [Sulfuricurvum sp.]